MDYCLLSKKNKNVLATIYHQNVTKQFVIISLYVNILFIDKIGATFSSQHLILVYISDYFHLFAYEFYVILFVYLFDSRNQYFSLFNSFPSCQMDVTIYHQNVTKQFVIISLYVNILFIDKIGATFSSQHLILVYISDYFHLFAYEFYVILFVYLFDSRNQYFSLFNSFPSCQMVIIIYGSTRHLKSFLTV